MTISIFSSLRKGVKRGPEDIAQEERQGMIVDYIFGQLMRRILRFYDGDNISGATIDTLEVVIFKFLVNAPLTKSVVIQKNREIVVDLFKEMLGEVAQYRYVGLH